jgi:hypothetical protein
MKTIRDMLLGAILVAITPALAAVVIPGIQGPWLGDTNTNLYTLATAIFNNSGQGTTSPFTPGPGNVQATCQPMLTPQVNIVTSVANGSVCLPKAAAGTDIELGNASGQTINIFGANAPFVAGTQDTINGTAGSTAYTNLTSGKSGSCFAPANGVWYCSTGN